MVVGVGVGVGVFFDKKWSKKLKSVSAKEIK